MLKFDNSFYFQGLGQLAEKFPSIANGCIDALRDFLVNPSPILLRLNRQSMDHQNVRNGNLSIMVTPECPSTVYSATTTSSGTAFENLRDTAIENLCRLVVICYVLSKFIMTL